jgi:hypothetical protein
VVCDRCIFPRCIGLVFQCGRVTWQPCFYFYSLISQFGVVIVVTMVQF